ncbi:MAG: trypsin-like peptidase domain-containing protein [Nitrospirae bacterium]|nr:trypsin-like peptidase domain-containing protein [Nitrospirota bacterium]MBF0533947.1 trypsin-like peptidase domain-containing protein [Nitrospirota bacterium]
MITFYKSMKLKLLLAVVLLLSFASTGYLETISVPPKYINTGAKKVDAYIKTLNFDTSMSQHEAVTVTVPTDTIDKLKSVRDTYTGPPIVGVNVDLPSHGETMFNTNIRELTTKDGLNTKRVAIYAKDAQAIRLHFVKLPVNTNVYIYGLKGQSSAHGPIEVDTENQSDGYWGPTVFGEVVFIEMLGNGDVNTSELVIDKINYFFLDPLSPGAKTLCSSEVDVNCDSTVSTYKKAIALITYINGSNSYLCSGALISDLGSTNTAWFLTANHCISSNTVAATLNAYFNYETSACNAGDANINNASQVVGSTYVISKDYSTGSDFSLLKLNSAPSGGAYYLGWTTSDITSGKGIHHPGGDYKRVSSGSIVSSNWSDLNNTNFWTVTWTSGLTEGGSSGSPLINSSGYIVGQLYGVSADQTCSSTTKYGIYGKFSKSYSDGLSTYLGATSTTTTAAGTNTTTTTSTIGGSKNVSYTLPYLHTNPSGVVYCMASNMTSSSQTGFVMVRANSVGTAFTPSYESTTFPLSGKTTEMLTFSGQALTAGTTSISLLAKTGGTATSTVMYSAKLTFSSNDSTSSCKSMGLACFQGTTSPKRNVLGVLCNDGSTYTSSDLAH